MPRCCTICLLEEEEEGGKLCTNACACVSSPTHPSCLLRWRTVCLPQHRDICAVCLAAYKTPLPLFCRLLRMAKTENDIFGPCVLLAMFGAALTIYPPLMAAGVTVSLGFLAQHGRKQLQVYLVTVLLTATVCFSVSQFALMLEINAAAREAAAEATATRPLPPIVFQTRGTVGKPNDKYKNKMFALAPG